MLPLILTLAAILGGTTAPGGVPILYTTDLYHPHQDPDDHFDLATLFALPEFDIRGIVFDCGPIGKDRPSVAALEQMTAITRRVVPYANGLSENLANEEDTCAGQATQEGVALILDVLRAAEKPVILFTAGSLRDVAAAYNREPELLKAKVARLYVNAGRVGGDEMEWNVQLDPAAYTRIMKSGLPIHWIPCFGVEGYQSYWKFRQEVVFDTVRPSLRQYFLYALEKMPFTCESTAFLTQPVDMDVLKKWRVQDRNMWCTAPLIHAAGRVGETYGFTPLTVRLTPDGKTIPAPDGDLTLQTFRAPNAEAYAKEMTTALRDTLAGL